MKDRQINRNAPIVLISLVVLITTFYCLLFYTADKAYCKEKQVVRNISVKLDYIPKEFNINMLNNDVLQKLFPELKEPKLFSENDLYDENDREYYLIEGNSFLVQGDFNKDGYIDIAFIIKGMDKVTLLKIIGFAIVSIKGNELIRDHFKIFTHSKKGFLKKTTNYKQGKDAISVCYALETDWEDFIYWNGKEYIAEDNKCCD